MAVLLTPGMQYSTGTVAASGTAALTAWLWGGVGGASVWKPSGSIKFGSACMARMSLQMCACGVGMRVFSSDDIIMM